ncbi:thioredoxin family protein [Parapusillimonas granuli]|uniref:Thioredoxin family protein n=1 Tax=Parapusillimonas granuli TaxID=380911 RepID=A0A853FTV8_9BURK|nr:thioredoxin family protein [Parapusillimonas granuli]MBB5215065.1 thiol-disulfide isomerase/thioredoxin [Parapusillimonas granuli]MEB2401372.1 thioredoxin family protein [Alcaligenaceae bacterium]NYT49384.1 thioredoxin family protein [Parapusillimonas granuli]
MPVYDPQHDTPALQARLARREGLVIACYCAAWCDTCRQYRPDFDGLAQKWPQHAFVWVDIEECPELLDDEDVENFPTILVQSQEGNLFFGTMLPYIGHLEKLVASLQDAAEVIEGGPGQLGTLLPAAAQ